jgi:NAD(P)-dependent dehydrogenase (short-subunit alcohol dehydrogenase family)
MQELAGKTAFVTGAASGIGLGIATVLSQAGVKVMLCDIEAAPLAEALAGVQAAGAEADAVKADVSVKSDLERAAEATIARFGKVHILVNNAGLSVGGQYGSWSDIGWRWMLDVNLMGVIWGIEIFGPLIEKHGEGGHIVSTGSAAGLISWTSIPYNVTKYGVVALSEGLRRDLAPRGIGVSVLCPGLVRTRIVDGARNVPDRFQAALAETPLGGPTTEQIAAMRDYIASGVDPLYVGELVREGIEQDWPYIFTDADFESAVDARFAEIKAGFDRIRDRTPRR